MVFAKAACLVCNGFAFGSRMKGQLQVVIGRRVSYPTQALPYWPPRLSRPALESRAESVQHAPVALSHRVLGREVLTVCLWATLGKCQG